MAQNDLNDTPDLVLYVKKNCPYCEEAIDFLKELKVRYKKIDVTSDEEAMDELEEVSGQDGTPTLVFGEDVLADCGVDQIEPFLKDHDLI